jgi:hypothetical protein
MKRNSKGKREKKIMKGKRGKKIYFEKKKQLILARTQVLPIFPFSLKNSHFQSNNQIKFIK